MKTWQRFLIVEALVILGIVLVPSPWLFLPGILLALLSAKGWLHRGIVFLLSLSVFLFSAPLIFQIMAKIWPDPLTGKETILVLGAGITGDQPQAYLRNRLDLALDILKDQPDSQVVVTGGKSPGDAYSEAQVMAKYLKDQGLAQDRIHQEDQASDTIENFRYSQELIQEAGLNPKILIITNDFHGFRSVHIAQSQGLEAKVRLAPSPPGVWYFRLRDVPSLIKVIWHYGFDLAINP